MGGRNLAVNCNFLEAKADPCRHAAAAINYVFSEDAEPAPSEREADQERECLSNSNEQLQ